MSLKKSINLAIFGLSLRSLNELKAQTEEIISDNFSINWTNIADPNLDALLINEQFFYTPSIQNLVKTYHHTVLCIKTSPNSQQSGIIQDGFLYLPLVDTRHYKAWLNDYVLNKKIQNVAATTVQHDIKEKLLVLEDLFNPQNGKVLVFDNQGQFGLVDPRSQWFWPNQERQALNTNYTFNFTFATMNDTLPFEKVTRQDLKFWLWNLLWKSVTYIDLAPEYGYFKIKYWPQPKDESDRRDILRMSACFVKGAEIKQVAKHLDISESRVRQFIAAGLGSGLLYKISSSNAQFITNDTTPSENNGVVKKFLNNLRRKLGF